MEAISVKLFEVGNLAAQVRKKFKWEMSGDLLLDTLESRLEMSGDTVPEASLANLSRRMMTVERDHERPTVLGISDGRRTGWDEMRYRFIIEVVLTAFERGNKRQKRAILQGYTDNAELTSRDDLDPDTQLVINSVLIVTDEEKRDGTIISRMSSCMQVCMGESGRDVAHRPVDVFNRLLAYEDDQDDDWDEETDLNSETCYHGGIKLNMRRHNQQGNYAGSILSSDMSARSASRSAKYSGDGGCSINTIAADTMTTDTSPSCNLFIKELIAVASNYRREGVLTYREFGRAMGMSHNDLADLTEITHFDDHEHESESWTGGTDEVRSAYITSHAIPYLMADTGYTTIAFVIDNLDDIRDPILEFDMDETTHAAGETFDDIRTLDAFEKNFINDIYRIISHDFQVYVEMEVNCDSSGLTEISIAYDEGDEEQFVFSSFADAMLCPANTNDPTAASRLAKGYVDIRKGVNSILERREDIYNGTHRDEDNRPSTSRRSNRSRDDRKRRSESVELSLR